MSQFRRRVRARPTHPRPDLRAGVGAAGQRERLRRAVDVVCAGGVLNPAEVALRPHADAVVRVRQLQSRCVVVVEGEHPARYPREVLQAPVRSCGTGSDFSLRDILCMGENDVCNLNTLLDASCSRPKMRSIHL